MTPRNQASKRIKKRLVDLDWSVTQLAKKLERPRPTVSAAINTKKFPRVRALVMEALDA